MQRCVLMAVSRLRPATWATTSWVGHVAHVGHAWPIPPQWDAF